MDRHNPARAKESMINNRARSLTVPRHYHARAAALILRHRIQNRKKETPAPQHMDMGGEGRGGEEGVAFYAAPPRRSQGTCPRMRISRTGRRIESRHESSSSRSILPAGTRAKRPLGPMSSRHGNVTITSSLAGRAAGIRSAWWGDSAGACVLSIVFHAWAHGSWSCDDDTDGTYSTCDAHGNVQYRP
jgi:hypothetical protein